LKALKSGLWFRALGNAERALVDVTIRVVDRIRSSVLAKALLSVIGKLLNASKSRVEVATKQIGLPCVRRLSLLAQTWGNKIARQWVYDLSFASFIAVMHINNPALLPS
jgi:peptidoglycan/xylan/chitin deacetylase (PgdA/CDA1 family)